ncbi:MAG: tetratricopeptide repeat protein [Microcystaceae cyanobacterium]
MKIKKDSDIVWVNKGIIQINLKRYSNAIESFKKALKINPNYQGINYNLACCYAFNNNKKQALKNLEIAINKNPKCLDFAKSALAFKALARDRKFISLFR